MVHFFYKLLQARQKRVRPAYRNIAKYIHRIYPDSFSKSNNYL